MIPKSQLFPGVIIRVVKAHRGTNGRCIYFWDALTGLRSAPLDVGATFEVLEPPRLVRNKTLVGVRWIGSTSSGYMRYGELHWHCEIVEDPRPKGRPLWERLDDDLGPS